MLKLKNISKYENGKTILNNINLSLGENDVISILSNEDTLNELVNIIAGISEASIGEVFMGERNITTTKPYDRNIAIVSKKSFLRNDLTVYDNLAYPLRRKKIKEDDAEARVDEIIDKLNLSIIQGCMISELSLYQTLKVSLARATLYYPNVLILEDPLSLMDENRHEEYVGFLKEVKEYLDPLCIIYLGRVIENANKVAEINEEGEMISYGQKEAVLSQQKTIEKIILPVTYNDKTLTYNDEKTIYTDIFSKRMIIHDEVKYIELLSTAFTTYDHDSDLKFKVIDIEDFGKIMKINFEGFSIIRDSNSKLAKAPYFYYPRYQVIFLNERKERLNTLREIIKAEVNIKINNITLGLVSIEGYSYHFLGKLEKDTNHLILNRDKIYELKEKKQNCLVVKRMISLEEFSMFYLITFISSKGKEPITLKVEKNDTLLKRKEMYIGISNEDLCMPNAAFTKRP